MQLQSETLLQGYSEKEKAAYFGALTSLATVDRQASEEEISHLQEMANAAGLSGVHEEDILRSAKDTTGNELLKNLEALKGSELRYSLVTDLIALAKVDGTYSDSEKTNIEKVSRYLNVDKNQFEVLDQFVSKASESEHSPEEIAKPGFVDSLGMQNQFAGAGLNLGSIGKNIFGMLGPMLIGGLAGRALSGGRSSGGIGGGLSGMLGGMLGGGNNANAGLGNMIPGGMGGLGSLISGLTRSKSNNGLGGMLGKLLK